MTGLKDSHWGIQARGEQNAGSNPLKAAKDEGFKAIIPPFNPFRKTLTQLGTLFVDSLTDARSPPVLYLAAAVRRYRGLFRGQTFMRTAELSLAAVYPDLHPTDPPRRAVEVYVTVCSFPLMVMPC